jgi:general stress protein YciG
MSKTRIPEDVMEYFRKTGREGGKARAKNHSPEQLSEWGKLGGRPKGSGKKKAATRKGAKK